MKDEYKKSAYLFCIALFFLGKSTLFAQTYSKDSIDLLLNSKGSGIERIQFLNNIAEKLSDKNTQLALDYANLALTEAKKNKLPKEIGIAFNNLAWITYRKGDFTMAFEYSTKGLHWNDSIQHLPALAASFRCMASVYNSQGNTSKSIEFFLKDLSLHSQLNDQKSIGRALNNLSFTYLRGKIFDSALIYTNKALAFNLKLKDDYLIAFAYRNAGDISEARKLTDSAKFYFNLSVQYATKINSIQLELTALYRIGRLLNSKKEFESSIPFLEKALQLSHQMGAKSETALIYNLLANAYEGIGNYKEAYQVQKKSSQLNDSLYQERSRSRLAEMQAKFEAEKKQSEINQLKHEKEQEIENNQKKTILNFSLMITMLVVIVLLINIWKKNKYKTATNLLLQKQKEELEETLLLKDKVFSIVSHDLRSPIASLNAVLPMLDPDSLDHDTYHELKLNLTKQVQNLNYVLDNLLIWSRSRMKGINNPELIDVNLYKQSSFSIELLKGLADQKKISIQNQINTGLSIHADPQHFDIIVRNILLNAIKFTHENGLIKITSKIENDRIALSIEDNGVGMQPEQINRLFQLKTHFTTPGTQKEKGTGLGLLICAEYAAVNNWEIKVDSQIGKGTIFTIILTKTNQ